MLLVTPGHVEDRDFDRAAELAQSENKDIEDVLIQEGFIQENQMGQLVAESKGVPFFDLKRERIDETLLLKIPELMARANALVILGRSQNGIKVGMRDPESLRARHLIEKRLGEPLIAGYITKSDLEKALGRYRLGLRGEVQRALEQLANRSIPAHERDNAITQIVDLLLQYGYQNGASDIHIEPYVKKVGIRFRIDGVMHDVLEMPKEIGEPSITRIKILAHLRTDEHRAAQDGKFRFSPVFYGDRVSASNSQVDVRVSIVPVTQGENAVLRLLSAHGRQFDLFALGLGEKDLERVRKAIRNPHGMILVTGPTGSGKTTTLYAVLKILNQREVHISTIEDPVEYDIEGVSQIQVNPKTNLTFAKGLRAIVRQDPDIIMIGEIRDEETANIAVNSAMTGHLVLSTLHANDTATTLPRLLEMGVDPFLVTSTVNMVIAQRLVRKICEQCRASASLSVQEKRFIMQEQEIEDFFKSKGYENLSKLIVFRGIGCEVCGNTGYAGRIGIFEILEMREEVKKLILKQSSSDEIMAQAKKDGMQTMLEDGLGKAMEGITTIEEVLRVIKT